VGEDVAVSGFTREDRQRYREKVHACLDAFARMLGESRFDGDRSSVGLEVELNLTDDDGVPAMTNAAVLERIADADFQTELAQFNVEINVAPRKLSGTVLSELEDGIRDTLNRAEERSRTTGSHMMIIGILPTVGERHLTVESFSENPRYQLLNEHDQGREDRQDAVIGEGRRPVGEVVLLELGDGALEDAAPRARLQAGRLVRSVLLAA
jgi:hypothetical protein